MPHLRIRLSSKLRVFVSNTMRDLSAARRAAVDRPRPLNLEPVNAENDDSGWALELGKGERSPQCARLRAADPGGKVRPTQTPCADDRNPRTLRQSSPIRLEMQHSQTITIDGRDGAWNVALVARSQNAGANVGGSVR